MKNIFEKLKKFFKKTANSALLFVVVFFVLVYLANFDTRNFFQEPKATLKSFAETLDFGTKSGIDSDKDGLFNEQEADFGTNALKTDTDGDGFDDAREIQNGYDPDAPGDARPRVEIRIEKIKVAAPMIWSESEDEKTQLEELQRGVIHLFDSAAPGQPGNMIVSGHSSNYIWMKGDFNYVFRNLNSLEAGDFVEVEEFFQNGKKMTFRYKVREKFVSTPDDERIFADSEKPVLTLSTCWPLGTNLRRLIVVAEIL